MKIFEVVTVGSALKDIMFYSDKISVVPAKKKDLTDKMLAVQYGAKIPIDEVFVNYGGGAMNVAVGLKNFGIYVSPLINVGNDQVGKEIHYYLHKNSIDTSLMNVDKERRTGFSLVMTASEDREHTIFTYKGASSFLKLPSLRGFRTKWFYVSALSSKDWAYEFEKITRQTRRNVKIAWNPGALQLENYRTMKNFLSDIEILILNQDEAMDFVFNNEKSVSKTDLKKGRFLLKTIQEYGPQKIVITQGAKGVIALDEHGKYYTIPAKNDKRRIVDTVGAGDAFSSGLMAGMIRWLNFEKALTLGIKNSASVLYKAGAQNGLLKIKL